MATEILFQAFKWDGTHNGRAGDWYEHVMSKVDDMVRACFTHVWLPPPSKARWQASMGYLPLDYYDLGEYRQWIQVWDDAAKQLKWIQHDAPSSLGPSYTGTETYFGHKTELLSLIQALHDKDIVSIADVVINHRDPQQVNAEDEWCCWGSADHQIESGKAVWGYKGRDDNPEEVSYRAGGAGIDDGEDGFGVNVAHTNAKARADIKDWLAWLKNTIGFGGWRYDYVKGFAPGHIGEYNYHTGNPFSVGEFWDTNAQLVYDWIDGTDAYDVAKRSMAFDFCMQEHLRKVFWGAKPFRELALWQHWWASIAGGWPEKAVTFLDNHDTARKAYNDFPTDAKRLIQGHVFLLTHPGVPCVFWSHMYDRGARVHDAIVRLGQLRSTMGIGRTTPVWVLRSNDICYAAKVGDRTLVKIGDEFWNPTGIAGTWKLELWGDGYAIWVAS